MLIDDLGVLFQFNLQSFAACRFENENQLPGEKINRDMRRAPSFSGPLMLPNRASANSLSAPIKSSGGISIIICIVSYFASSGIF